MKDNANQNTENITVDIHGETDWLRFSYDKVALAALKNPSENMPLLGASLGQLLDGDPMVPLTQEKELEICELLARYIANLNSYNTMLSYGFKSMVITVFRTKTEQVEGYTIRVAGVVKDDFNDVTVFVDGVPVEATYGPHFILLDLLRSTSCIYKEKYHPDSTFHLLMQQVKNIHCKIEFRKQACPNLQ